MTIDDSLRRQGIKILEDEQNALDGAFDAQTTEKAPDGITFKRFDQADDGKWSEEEYTPPELFYDESVVKSKEIEIENKAEVLQGLCREVDNKIIRLNNTINQKKQEIVNLSLEAINGNCNPGIAQSTTGTPGEVGYTTSLVTNTTINNDVEFVKIYDKMAGPGYDPGAENPFDPDRIVTLNSSYSGYGYENRRDNKEFRNTSNVATGLGTDGSGSNIGIGRFDLTTTVSSHQAGIPLVGYTYNGAGVAPATDTSVTPARCVAIASSIDTIYQQIIQIRKDRDSLRGALNQVKDNKSEKELANWGMKNTKNEVTSRKTANQTAIRGIQNLDVQEEASPLPQGLQLELDTANNSSYYGSGTIWYDLTDNNDADIVGGPTFIDDPSSDEKNRFDFDGSDDHVNFTAANIDGNTETVTVEVLAKLTIDLDTEANVGYMIFGWNKYDVWTGPITGIGTHYPLGYNTSGSNLYGLNGSRLENLGINNNFIHYVFEMRSDVSFTNNKIYINGNLQTGLETIREGNGENASNRNFNNGQGRIAGWRFNSNYRIPMEISLFRVYNKALTQEEVTARYNAVNGRFA
jgi:hypothetical protein